MRQVPLDLASHNLADMLVPPTSDTHADIRHSGNFSRRTLLGRVLCAVCCVLCGFKVIE